MIEEPNISYLIQMTKKQDAVTEEKAEEIREKLKEMKNDG